MTFIESCDCLFLGPVPKEGNVLKVMEYIATMVDFEECVAEALEYLVELSKQDDNFSLDINGKRMIKAAMRNNLPIKEIQIAGCNLFNCLIISGRKSREYSLMYMCKDKFEHAYMYG